MKIDSRFPTKLDGINDAPERLRSALRENFPSDESIRFLVHAPAFSAADEKTPATVLVVTNDGWLLASETEDGGSTTEKSDFSETLFLELTSILLRGQLRIHFATVGTAYSATMIFETVGEGLYREAINLMLGKIDQSRFPAITSERDAGSNLEPWPIKWRTAIEWYRPKGQRVSAAVHWPAVFDGFKREIAPAGLLMVTDREVVTITQEKQSLRQLSGGIDGFGGVITYFPLARLADFHVSHHARFGILALQVHAAHGGEKMEIIFPSDQERTVSNAMEQIERFSERPAQNLQPPSSKG